MAHQKNNEDRPPGTIDVLIVDDEPVARRTIRLLLKDDPEIGDIAECPNGSSAVQFINNQRPDLLFLDIQMPGMSGFEVLQQCSHDKLPVTIFVTAFDQFALKAFEVHALDYLLKPFDDERFRRTLTRAKRHIFDEKIHEMTKRLTDLLKTQSLISSAKDSNHHETFQQRFSVKSKGKVFFVDAHDIDWIGSAGNYVEIHAGRQTHLVRESLNSFSTKLDPTEFIRVHRSAIVRMGRVKELQPLFYGEYRILLHDGTKLTLSRTFKREFFERTKITP